MKKKLTITFLSLAVVALAWFALPPLIAFAQETLTPTVTSQAILDVSTPTPRTYDENNECPPSGEVQGMGTTTPSAYWLYQCSHCLVTPEGTSTPAPVPTWDGTGTPPPTTTITPTTTPDPNAQPTQDSSVPPFNSSSSIIVQPVEGWFWNGTDYHDSQCIYGSGQTGVVSDYQLSCWVHITSTSSDKRPSWSLTIDPEYSLGYADDLPVTLYIYHDFECVNCQGIDNLASSFVVDHYIGSEYVKYFFNLPEYSYDGVSFWGNIIVTASSADPFAPPVPTATPYPDVFCGSIEPEVDDTQIFGFEGLEFGAISCVDLLPYEISILGVDLSIPHFAHICFQDVSLGSAYIFGFEIDMDAPLYALGVAWALRNLFIS